MNIRSLILCIVVAALCMHCGGESGVNDGGGTPDGGSFEYKACASANKVLQFPTPAWEVPGDSPTGVLLQPPLSDAAAKLLRQTRLKWYEQFKGIDGVPLHSTWFVALEQKASKADASMARLYLARNGSISELKTEFTAVPSDTDTVLMLKTAGPLPVPEKGDRFILALYSGATDGPVPLPACDANGAAHASYIDAANALKGAGFGKDLVYAMPFTVSRMTAELPALYRKLASVPALVVESSKKRDYDSFGTRAPKADAKSVLAAEAYSGILATPAYQADLGAFAVDFTSGTPVEQGKTKPGFLVALPKTGTAPYPVVVFQHGGGGYKDDMFAVVKPFASAGFAMLGIDMPYHGDRSPYPDRNGSDAEMADFDAPLRSRDNFRQAAADHIALITGMETLNSALKGLTGFERTLDPSKLFYVGHSMGALAGSITAGSTQSLLGTSLVAGGGLYSRIVQEGMFAVPINDILKNMTATGRDLMLAFMQALLDGGDPAGYPVLQEDHGSRPKDVLVWECIKDPIMNNTATDILGSRFGASLLSPFNHAVPGMPEAGAPVAGNFQWPGSSLKATRLLIQREYPDVKEIQLHSWIFYSDMLPHEKAAACFAGRLNNGECRYE